MSTNRVRDYLSQQKIDNMHTSKREQTYSYNLGFRFNWNDYRTIKASEAKLAEIGSFQDNDNEREDFAYLCYQVGTFYNHIKREPDFALPYLYFAKQRLTGDQLAWTQNHLAFSYQQKKYYLPALQYCQAVKSQYENANSPEQIKIVAFAHCVQALTEYEMGKMTDALASYRLALDLYEKIGALDDQYARAKNRWAMMLVENKQTDEAQKAFGELENYWTKNQDTLNPYPARFYNTYGDFLKTKSTPDLAGALDKFKNAHQILCVTDGKENKFTQDVANKIQEVEKRWNESLNPTEVNVGMQLRR